MLEDLDPECENDGEREAFETEYYAAVTAAKVILATRRREAVNFRLENQNAGQRVNMMDHVKLPPIHLPTFNGSMAEFSRYI